MDSVGDRIDIRCVSISNDLDSICSVVGDGGALSTMPLN